MDTFLTYLLAPFTDNLDDLQIETKQNATQTEIVIHAPSSNMGLLIGKQGRTVSALRQLCRLYGNINQQNILLHIEEKSS